MKKMASKIACGVALAGVLAAGSVSAQMATTNNNVIDTAVQAVIQSKIEESFNKKVAMDEMRSKFMSDPQVVNSVVEKIKPVMMQEMKDKIMSQQMDKMSNMQM